MDGLTPLSKAVFSSTLTEPLAWANTRLVTGDAVEAVRAMKAGGRGELRTLGSVSLCRSLITAGPVDRFRVVVFPLVTGATGRDRIYDGYPDIRLNLIESRTYEGGIQLLEYVPTLLDGPIRNPFGILLWRRRRRRRRCVALARTTPHLTSSLGLDEDGATAAIP